MRQFWGHQNQDKDNKTPWRTEQSFDKEKKNPDPIKSLQDHRQISCLLNSLANIQKAAKDIILNDNNDAIQTRTRLPVNNMLNTTKIQMQISIFHFGI